MKSRLEIGDNIAQQIKKDKRTIYVERTITRMESDTDFTTLTFDEVVGGFVKIKDATPLLSMKNPDYVRRLLSQGKLEGILVRARGHVVWLISRNSIQYYTEHKAKRFAHRRYTLKIDQIDEDRVRAALDQLDIFYELTLAYKRKPRNDEEDGWIF